MAVKQQKQIAFVIDDDLMKRFRGACERESIRPLNVLREFIFNWTKEQEEKEYESGNTRDDKAV